MRHFFYAVSLISHPIFLALYFVLILSLVNPVFMDTSKGSGSDLILIQLIFSTILFPLVATLMMKGLNLIDSIELKDKKERVGPLLITAIFYLWMYLNYRKLSLVPDYLTSFILGSTLILFISFSITLFEKISIHTAALAGLITAVFILKERYTFTEFAINLGSLKYIVNTNVLGMILIVCLGMVATARIYLKDHTHRQAYLGVIIGVISMMIGYIS